MPTLLASPESKPLARNAETTVPIDAMRRYYSDLSSAYEHFNSALFEGRLPNCLITLQRRKGAYGYFAADRFSNDGSPLETLDEIALNPALFGGRRPEAIFSTLVQEMTHQWQHHFGKPSRGHCNKQWAAQMRKIGMIPTDTGAPGGKEIGRRMTCYVEAGGAFERACSTFLASNAAILYQDRTSEEEEAMRRKKAASKTRYTCPGCRANAWAKPDIALVCGTCHRKLEAVGSARTPVALSPAEHAPSAASVVAEGEQLHRTM
ncbi:MAG: hypothetical protein JWL77_5935 [Chthonomonadaceae bacterium]|nr:hypothetical protein [Chthonomonadaceae bacterium]